MSDDAGCKTNGSLMKDNSDEATCAKVPRLDTTEVQEAKQQQEQDEQQQNLQHDFSKFRLLEVLDCSQRSKYIALLGKFDSDTTSTAVDATVESSETSRACENSSAVLLLEKEAFPVDHLQKLLKEQQAKKQENGLEFLDFINPQSGGGETVMHNDIWHKYRLPLNPSLCLAKATLVHPATERLANKYRRRAMYLVAECPEDYAERTEPALAAAGAKHSINWVSNILDGSSEQDRLVFEDPDPKVGFVLHADLKWDGRKSDDLYCLAVCRLTGLHCVRQLCSEHLPLLENLMSKGRQALRERYGVPLSQQRVFLHYQPSFYHLHAHFTHVSADWPGQQAERAHLLSDVINNIRLMSDYYQKATLTFAVKEGEPLYEAYKDRLD